MIQAEIQLAGPPPGSPFPSHDAHFIAGEQAQLAPYLFNQAIVSQLTTLPIGSSSGGFSYGLDASLGIFSRTTGSFGPAFADRALTIGRNRFSFGTNFQHSGFDTFEGKDLRDGSIKFYLTHKPESGAFFEGDVIETALDLRLKTDTAAFFGDYGVTNRLDVGVAVPIVSVTMDASIDATVLRLATGTTGPTSTIHTFPGGGEQQTTTNPAAHKGLATCSSGQNIAFSTARVVDWQPESIFDSRLATKPTCWGPGPPRQGCHSLPHGHSTSLRRTSTSGTPFPARRARRSLRFPTNSITQRALKLRQRRESRLLAISSGEAFAIAGVCRSNRACSTS